MTDMYVSSFEDMLYQLTGYNGGVKFVGYPSEDGTSNHTFQIDGSIAISSTCADKTAAWNFMKQFLTEDYQSAAPSDPISHRERNPVRRPPGSPYRCGSPRR